MAHLLLNLLLGVWLVQFSLAAQVKVSAPSVPAPAEEDEDEDIGAKLAKVRRIFVDTLTGGDSALKIRDLLMASLQSSKLFVITENEEKADAVLKGAAEDSIFNEFFSSTDGLNAHSQISLPSSDNSRYSGRTGASMGIGQNESRRTEERKHEAMATVRLVSNDGDVIWSTTQESFGGKFLGAAADVADKVAKRLVADIRKAKAAPTAERLLKNGK